MSVHSSKDDRPSLRVRYLRQFGRDEDGGVIVLTLLLLVLMLVMGGMAVDFMRFESRRVVLQNVTDRAVLAAAELDQGLDGEDVVRGYFRSEGLESSLKEPININNSPGSRSVTVESELDMSTFYTKFIGLETLTAPGYARAIEGTGNVEISLVLDISGSMGTSVSQVDGTSGTRMSLLRDAAENFVTTLLIPEYQDEISLSLVQYSANVNIGEGIYRALNTTPDSILSNDDLIDTSDIPGLQAEADDSSNDFDQSDLDTLLEDIVTNPWRCVEILPSEFATTVFDTERTYTQVARLDDRSSTSEFTGPLCPEADPENNRDPSIIPLSQDAASLTQVIRNLQPTRTTSIHLGMKWGVSLLDPSMRTLLGNVADVDPAFAGIRPLDYEQNASSEDSKKYVILMTDGENVATRHVQDDIWADPFWRRTFTNYPYIYWYNSVNDHPEGLRPGWGGVTEYPNNAAQQDVWLQQICSAARDRNIVVYTISMGAPDNGAAQMRQCAFTENYYFDAEETAIDDIFQNIARQITALRLSQ
ncbi:Tad domain-containing protein [Cognatiyoonia sp. IB215446]|uniref:Tad domain-containing protein n=1 Tax=Cognatiyoonia sp. IB215446 TaxID=3097355 RepID=UPI002A116FA0|nr:Tad domain-containing protein [Cognatiyoonia sp. IB215446]MDX8347695.1 Tad domain-containing protein [Cognatiyoonia sp. IB215446]